MDFTPTETRQMLADTLDRWLLRDYPLEARLEAGASELGFSRKKWQDLAELGVIAALFPEDCGGFGGSGFDLSLVFEHLGKGLVVEPLLESAVLFGGVLMECGGQEERVARIIAGDELGVLAHFEEGDGFDASGIGTIAMKTAGGWSLSGQKAVVRNAASADCLVVSAQGDEGLSLFLMPADCPGLSLQSYPTIDGGQAAEVLLRDVTLPNEALLGEVGQAEKMLTPVLGRALLCLSAEALGLMGAIRDMTIEFLRTRQQFGQPIGRFQALQHRMAEMLLEIEGAKSAVINAAAAVDQPGMPRERGLSAAKFTIGRVGTLVAEEAIQLHGGIGMTWEYPLGHFAKRLVMIDHQLGDEDEHLSRYIRLGEEAEIG